MNGRDDIQKKWWEYNYLLLRQMFLSHSKIVSLLLSIMTMITWGTNKIAVKYLTYPVSLYTIDFFTWVFIFHTIFSFTLGASWFPSDKQDTFKNILDIVHLGVSNSFYIFHV